MEPQDVHGNWECEYMPDGSVVRLRFTHLGPEGVEMFETAMPPEAAIVLATNILNQALECGPDVLGMDNETS